MISAQVCEDQVVEWTLYRGRHVARDAREGAIGDTEVELEDDRELEIVLCEARPRWKKTEISALQLCHDLAARAKDCLVSVDEIFQVKGIVARITEVRRHVEDEDDEFRGLVTEKTKFYVVAKGLPVLTLTGPRDDPPPRREPPNQVLVTCDDDEVFPVKRDLLRPCVALTSVVQSGKGKYPQKDDCTVAMDCCTFDRVLLYLEHAQSNNGHPFKFDPTLAPELLRAAETLKIAGLKEEAAKVLGSFEDRVRREPIRLAEIIQRNHRGGLVEPRSETLLVVDGMVLDVSRWLHEHPGGSAIIPEQALNVDATIMFECYHVSRQSFLYLKEFYIGELDKDDRSNLPLPNADIVGDVACTASDAFIDNLRSFTPWRLKPTDLIIPLHKSF